MLIDVHNHFYPPEYLDALKAGDSAVKLTIDPEGNPCIHYPGDFNVAVRGHRDIDYRADVLARDGVDTQVITLTTPGTHVEPPPRAVRLARLVNDAFAAIVRKLRIVVLQISAVLQKRCDCFEGFLNTRQAFDGTLSDVT